MRMPDFYSCHPKQALAGVGQPGGRAGVVTPRGGSNPAPGLTLPPTLDPRQVAEFLSLFVEDDRRMFLRPAATQEAPPPEL